MSQAQRRCIKLFVMAKLGLFLALPAPSRWTRNSANLSRSWLVFQIGECAHLEVVKAPKTTICEALVMKCGFDQDFAQKRQKSGHVETAGRLYFDQLMFINKGSVLKSGFNTRITNGWSLLHKPPSSSSTVYASQSLRSSFRKKAHTI